MLIFARDDRSDQRCGRAIFNDYVRQCPGQTWIPFEDGNAITHGAANQLSLQRWDIGIGSRPFRSGGFHRLFAQTFYKNFDFGTDELGIVLFADLIL